MKFINLEEFNKNQSEMSNIDLLKKIRDLLNKLCLTGGKSLSMSVPPRGDDFDMLVCELMRRFQNKIDGKSDLESCAGCRFYNSCGIRIDYDNVRCPDFLP